MDWNLFWTAFGAIGGTLGAVATTAAVVVALWQTKYSQKKIIKLTFSDNFQFFVLYVHLEPGGHEKLLLRFLLSGHRL